MFLRWFCSSIFSVFLGRELLGQRVCDQKAAAITLYGPRTTIIVRIARLSSAAQRAVEIVTV